MICPGCGEYVVTGSLNELKNLRNCPHCNLEIDVCKRCFGTGQIETFMSGGGDHRRRTLIECDNCKGRGLLSPSLSK